jgi:GNAT superfamily N-acetyltransferase
MVSVIEIRRASGDDAAEIAAVLYEAFVEYRPLYSAEGFAATVPDERQIVSRIGEGPVWVASIADGAMIGTVGAVVKEQGVYMRGMAIVRANRGRGLGAKLVETVELWSMEHGHRRVFLGTTPFLHAAIRLYERLGFARTNDGPNDHFGTPLITLEKHLPAKK